jgi:hypothetical protein
VKRRGEPTSVAGCRLQHATRAEQAGCARMPRERGSTESSSWWVPRADGATRTPQSCTIRRMCEAFRDECTRRRDDSSGVVQGQRMAPRTRPGMTFVT